MASPVELADNAQMGRTGRQRLGGGLALRPGPAPLIAPVALIVIAAGVLIVKTRDAEPLSRAVTSVAAASDAQIVHPDGRIAPATAGMPVRAGDVLQTGNTGSADLRTRSRDVYVGPNAAVFVRNGAEQQLRTGTVVVDAQRGPGLRLDVAGDRVAIPSGAATEAARSVTVRVGALAGTAVLTAATGRHLTIRPLSQAVVTGDALPTATTVLQLTDSPAEARAVPGLVHDDRALQTLAAGIDATAPATAAAVDAAWGGTLAPRPVGAPRSEAVLPVVIADATSVGGTAQQRYDRVVTWRRAGGSWGVVLHLLDGRTERVLATFAALSRANPAGPGGTAAVAAGPGAAAGAPAGPAGAAAVTHPSRAGGSTGHPGSGPSPHPTRAPGGGSPTPAPTPTKSGLVGSLVSTAGHVIGGVVSLLPIPSHSPRSGHAAPTPAPTATSLLGGLGH